MTDIKKKLYWFLFFILTVNMNADFIKSGDIVTDSTTGLQWQDNNETKSLKFTWIEAINYCEGLNLGEYSDWNLPNINEFKTLIDRSKKKPAIVNGFENIVSSSYWSSSTTHRDTSSAWIIRFYYGYVNGSSKTDDNYIRCVRTKDFASL